MSREEKTIHGNAEIIKEINHFPHPVGTKGQITAFIPKNKLFSVYFEDGLWITLEDWTLDAFKSHFKYELFNEEVTMKRTY